MLPIIWRSCARNDLREIVGYIARDNPLAARRMKERLEASVLPLSEHPYLYRISERVPGLREIVAHPNYLVLYRVTATRIEVVNVVHTRREFPQRSGDGR
ncbi:type II toxin-antitoxin system RelE/ParE family toxin [Verminephrobacter eiseniae]|uniref:type II toxin-antitoxin system RelE/ParE family toxin n=1 Tax=Verminephrobacter eiseniae TaxID=364317 RepID=UPI00223860A7|nr:type II toxin-antitoxin system RelE/ParE family toxin [Verminephrobacter eiseniae]MCW5238537.1 type II toxin-antitoxin system RelE/ParE family toxin [Verminephrobacter eiseniae]